MANFRTEWEICKTELPWCYQKVGNFSKSNREKKGRKEMNQRKPTTVGGHRNQLKELLMDIIGTI